MKRLTQVGLLILLSALPVWAQVDKQCRGRVFSSQEVSKRARITQAPKLNVGLNHLRAPARFVIDAILCRSGHVTDIRVIAGMSPEINEFARAAVYLVKFEPAEYRWHTVSQRMRFELEFGPKESEMKVRMSDGPADQLVESVEVIGNRRLTTREILSRIQTRPGDRYSEEKLKRDFEALLATGYFDKLQTRAMIENGVRGGVRVIFEVLELARP